MNRPAYRELPRPDGESLPLAWNLWKDGDQIGMWNNVTPECTIAAARLVRQGRRFNLNLPLDEPLGLIPPGSHALRRAPVHDVYRFFDGEMIGMDDRIDLYLSGSTQWDGLTHIGDPLHGFYNGVTKDQLRADEGRPNGIGEVADFAVATRAVLIDIPSHFASTGREWAADRSFVASADDLAASLLRTGQTIRAGDVLLVRTGFTKAFREADTATKERLISRRDYSGVSGGEDMWEFLWDNGIAAIASDSVAVEQFPISHKRPSLHLAIARLGLSLGELFYLEEIAEYSIAHDDYAYFFTTMPLNLRGGVGSPANAIAII